MSQQIPNVRIESDITLKVKLTDSSVAIDWTTLTNVSAYIYSDSQRILASAVQSAISQTDNTILNVNYLATDPQYLGVARLVIRCTYQGRKKTYDVAVANIVPQTSEATGQTTITDPVVDVQLTVTEISTSLIEELVDACIAATASATAAATSATTAAGTATSAATAATAAAANANTAASHGPYINSTNNHWMVWDNTTGQYVDTGISAAGEGAAFVATYGVTSYADVLAAYNAGKTIYAYKELMDGTVFVPMVFYSGEEIFYFAAYYNDGLPAFVQINLDVESWGDSQPVTPEYSSNKKNAISGNESSSTYYPTTKAVADYVAAKKDIFVAMYGETTFEEVVEAMEDGKFVVAKDEETDADKYYMLTSISEGVFRFTGMEDWVSSYFELYDDDDWRKGTYELEVTSNKKTTLPSSTENDSEWYAAIGLVRSVKTAIENTITAIQSAVTALQTSVSNILALIPSQATSSNQLADKNFVNSSINSVSAFYITSDASGSAFATKAALLAGPYYNQGAIRVLTRNDYAFVIADETQSDASTRYVFDGINWAFQYKVNDRPLTEAQIAAMNSGIIAEMIPTGTSSTNKLVNQTGLDTKQDTISDLATIRSGAALGATALQEVPNTYRTSAAQDVIDATKITNPSGGTTGQVLTKTASGEEWATPQGCDTTAEEVTAAALNDLYDQTLSATRKTVLKSDIINDLVHPAKDQPISAWIAVVLNSKFAEIELVAAAALNDLNQTKAFIDCVAPAWNGWSTYSVGDLRTHNGKLWKCDTAITTPEVQFDATKWHTTTIVDEFNL